MKRFKALMKRFKALSSTLYAMKSKRDTRLLDLDALLCGVKPTECNRAWFTRVNIAVRECMNGPDYDASHDYEHCVRVVGIAHLIWMKERWALETDPLVVFTAALVHDIGDGKYPKSAAKGRNLMTTEQQRERQRKIVHSFLIKLACPPHIADAAAEIASSVSFLLERNDPAHVQEVLRRLPALAIVQDADRLDALGEMGIARAALFGGVNEKRRKNTIMTLVELMDVRLAHYPGMMKTEMGKARAESAWEYMVQFKKGIEEQADCETILQDD